MVAFRTFLSKIAIFLVLWTHPFIGQAGPYIEAGTSLGTIKSGDAFFNKAGSSSTGTGFVGSMSIYFTALPIFGFSHFDFGLQNRISLGGTSSGSQLAMFTPNLAIRYEFFRFFAGAGYAPIAYGGADGTSSLHAISGGSSYFFEGGAIWRVIPEFQIVAAVGFEYGRVNGTGSPANTEYGLRFRFPLSPKDDASMKAVKWDGFRYPFGVWRE